MSREQPIQRSDIERLADREAPDLLQAIEAFLEQGEPDPPDPRPTDLFDTAALRAALAAAARKREKKQRQASAREAWGRYLSQPEAYIAPQMKLADLIVRLYETKTGPARQALFTIAREAPLVFGIWGGLKRVYKRAEEDLDAEVFGVLAARFDSARTARGPSNVRAATLTYMTRRASRFLRYLGKSLPTLYPSFVVEVLRSYPEGTDYATIWGDLESPSKKWGAPVGLAKDKKFRVAYRDAWARSVDPLMLLLETCKADVGASFAIDGLRALFPDALRNVSPAWLARLAFRPLEAAHDLLVETLEASPEYHQGKLQKLGLHDAVLKLLVSPSAKARKYAIEYARGHASDLSNERLVQLLVDAESYQDTGKFVATILMARPARQLGLTMLGRLVGISLTSKWATAALEHDWDKKELTHEFLIDMLLSSERDRSVWAETFIDKKLKPEELPMSFWIKALDDPRLKDANYRVARFLTDRLVKQKVEVAPGDWLLDALARDDIGRAIGEWLKKAESLPSGVDLERIRGLVFDPSRRHVAFALLGNRKLVSPRDVGLGWLLALARRADPELHEWAHRYLLQHMRPEHFAEGKEDAKAGIARLFALATGKKEPEAVRVFAQTYLKCHHPKIAKDQPETKQLGLKPLIPRDAYTEARIGPSLFDTRGDVRRFAALVTRSELRRWGAQTKVYELADASAKEVRNIAYEALSQAGQRHADPDLALLPSELDAAQIFSLTESRVRSTRDVAIELIRKHYALIGGPTRLGWLMQSADKDVRTLAVRLLWEKHRPRGVPSDWKPPGAKAPLEQGAAYTDAEALRDLLRRLLFTVPPSRSLEALEKARSRKLPSSVAKRNLIELVKDFGQKEASFAKLVAPVLGEMTGSVSKGEWQTCLSALMTLRRVHGVALPELR